MEKGPTSRARFLPSGALLHDEPTVANCRGRRAASKSGCGFQVLRKYGRQGTGQMAWSRVSSRDGLDQWRIYVQYMFHIIHQLICLLLLAEEPHGFQ